MKETNRTATDALGEVHVPAGAYYGAQTARAVENFPISGLRFPRLFLWALGMVKKHAALTNAELGGLGEEKAQAIAQAASEVAEGRWDDQFVVDIFQTGSGTSTNMNANEVIARRAGEILGTQAGPEQIHPNDDVNRSQSSNDVMPTALHIAALEASTTGLLPALRTLHQVLAEKAVQFGEVLKIGRTHLQDATPMRLGQTFGGFSSQLEHGLVRLDKALPSLGELALGGTAIGTGINAHPEFASRTITRIARETGLNLREAPNHFEAQSGRDACVEASGALKTVAVSLIKIANDIRFLGSGPRCGLGELILPAIQPGSSIMPGKVNPVLCETVLQVAVQVIANDTAITLGGAYGNFELNAMLPVIAHNLLQSISLLSSACRAFAVRCVAGLEADRDRCGREVEQSLALATALVPKIGYDRAVLIAQTAEKTGRTVREVAREMAGLEEVVLARLLDQAPG